MPLGVLTALYPLPCIKPRNAVSMTYYGSLRGNWQPYKFVVDGNAAFI